MAFIWRNVVYLSDYINCTKRLNGTYIGIVSWHIFLPCCEMNFGFSTWRYKMLNILLIHFRKSSLHFYISNEISNFTSFRVNLPRQRSGLDAPSNKTTVTKSIACDSNSWTRRQPLQINFLIKSVTVGSSGSAISEPLPVLW